jgi:hypothetical protein
MVRQPNMLTPKLSEKSVTASDKTSRLKAAQSADFS